MGGAGEVDRGRVEMVEGQIKKVNGGEGRTVMCSKLARMSLQMHFPFTTRSMPTFRLRHSEVGLT